MTVDIDLEVDETSKPSGVTVKEYVPAGWTATSATPDFDSWEPSTGEIKWVFVGGQVSDTGMDITYEVAVPGDATGAKTFSGQLLYNHPITGEPAEESIGGDTQARPCHAADANGDCVIDDFELLDYIDLWASGQVGDFELLDTIDLWAAGCYCWDPVPEEFTPCGQP